MRTDRSSRRSLAAALGLVLLALPLSPLAASDWPRFHGPDGAGISPDTKPLPVKWSATENVAWKCPLPGSGSSSPIVVGTRVLVTCWTGTGADLRRHLICVDRAKGAVLWDKAVDAVQPEDSYSGQFTQHGYASHTPVSDGQHVYVFFGKTGVLAFDLEGKQLWQTSVGTGSGGNGWGTASSPILYKDLVIVPATAESAALVALNKETGKEVWRRSDPGFGNTWGTPILMDCGQGRTDLVMAVPDHIWAFNPDDGTPRWQSEGYPGATCASVVARDGVIYFLETGPRGGGTIAVRGGGTGEVSSTNIVWKGTERARIGTPVVDGGRIYWVISRTANCVDAATGKLVYQTRLGTGEQAGGPGGPGGPPGGGRGGRGGGRGADYSSPVLANGNIYYVARSGDAFVYTAGPEAKLLSQNSLADGGDFSATPAISDGQLFIRSSKFLYCIADGK